MLEKVRQYKEFVFIFLFIFILNSLINFSPGDDEYFKNISKTMSLYDFIYMRYTIWSGRVFADSILYLIMDENIWIWRILNSIIIFMLPIAIVRIFSMKISFKYFLIAFCSICCISFNVISSGFLWVTGSINYSWPILLGILSSIIYTDILFNKTHKLKRKYIIFSSLMGFLGACSNEQVALCLICFSIIFHIVLIIKKDRRHICVILPSIFIILGGLIVLNAPGSDLRWKAEVNTYFPGFDGLSFKEHFYIWVIWFFDRFINEMRGLILLLSIITIFKIVHDKIYSKMSKVFLIMFSLYIIFLINNSLTINLFDFNNIKFFDISGNILNFHDVKIDFWKSLFPYIFWIIYLLVLAYEIIIKSKHKVLISLCCGAAFASMAVMFVSPTIYASGNRTLAVTAIFMCVILFESLYLKLNNNLMILLFSIYPLLNILALMIKWIINGYSTLY